MTGLIKQGTVLETNSIIGIAVGASLALILFSFVVFVLVWKRRVKAKQNEPPSLDLELEDRYSSIPTFLPTTKPRSYPSKTALISSQAIIDYSEITMGRKVGSGAFGEVFDARWYKMMLVLFAKERNACRS